MLVIGVLAGVVTGAVAVIVPWLPDAASEQADEIDAVYWFVTIICVAVFALVAGRRVYAGWKFRARDDDMDDGAPIHGNTGLEIAWTALPVALVVAMSIFSIIVLDRISTVPAGPPHRRGQRDAVRLDASPTRSSTVRPGDLVLELDEPYEMSITATDVIHSFWVPEFRMKQDAVPGVVTQTLRDADEGRHVPGHLHGALRARAQHDAGPRDRALARRLREVGAEGKKEGGAAAAARRAACRSSRPSARPATRSPPRRRPGRSAPTSILSSPGKMRTSSAPRSSIPTPRSPRASTRT